MMPPIQFEGFSETEVGFPAPPDLLRRFVPLPRRGTVTWNELHFEVQTNHPGVAATFVGSQPPDGASVIRLSLFVDPDLPPADQVEPIIITGATVCWGHSYAGLFAFDREANEMFVILAESCVEQWPTAFVEILRFWRQPGIAPEDEKRENSRPHSVEFV